jgi:hypothetical protein
VLSLLLQGIRTIMRTSAGVIAMGKGADVGVGRKTARKRAVGTREHIMAYLTEVNELCDANGMASTQLAAAVGYPGSSVAFAQLLSGMERSGLIEREVRGKRTYRINLGPAHAIGSGGAARASGISGIPEVAMAVGVSGAAGVGGSGGVGGEVGSGIGAAGFDYDELARRLLVQVVRRLAAAEPAASHQDRSAPDPSASDPLASDPLASDPLASDPLAPDRLAPDRLAPDWLALQETVTGLEYELATAWSKHGKLAEENVRLREQLRDAQRSLALAAERVRRLPASTDLDRSEVVLLQRLLVSGGTDSLVRPDGPDEARGSVGSVGSGHAAGSLAEAPSLLS